MVKARWIRQNLERGKSVHTKTVLVARNSTRRFCQPELVTAPGSQSSNTQHFDGSSLTRPLEKEYDLTFDKSNFRLS